MFIRTEFNYDRDAVSKETGLVCDADSPLDNRTHQEFREDSDINEIVRRFGLTGKLPDDYRAPVSGDFADVVDFKTAMDAVSAAQSSFMEMPADLRARFENDPQRLMSFLENPKNRDEAVELGLVSVPPVPVRGTVEAIDELAAKLVVKPE